MCYGMEFDRLFSNYENIFSYMIRQLNDGGVSRVIMILLGHRVRKIIDLTYLRIHLANALCRTIRPFIKQQQDRAGKTVVTQKFLRYS